MGAVRVHFIRGDIFTAQQAYQGPYKAFQRVRPVERISVTILARTDVGNLGHAVRTVWRSESMVSLLRASEFASPDSALAVFSLETRDSFESCIAHFSLSQVMSSALFVASAVTGDAYTL